eukprot:m.190324 g.190324  ORF g.190324 m.190324 type:complete len:405 (-) comp25684_c1_seq1:60-1274(-)
MSRRALEHQAKLAAQTAFPAEALEPLDPEYVSPNALPIWGNPTTMNMNNILYTNIKESSYFRERCVEIQTFLELVDEIYNCVDHLEPFMPGHANAASTAFCLLYKLFLMRPTENQMMHLLNHADSPYIRATGFLFLRFTCPPKDLLAWFGDYLDDPEPVRVRMGASSPEIPMGVYLRGLLKNQAYFSTRFPRIPVLIEREVRAELDAHPYAGESFEGEEEYEEEEPEQEERPPARSRSRTPRSPPRRRSRSPVRRRTPPRFRRSRSRTPPRRRSPSPRHYRKFSPSPPRRRYSHSRSRSPRRKERRDRERSRDRDRSRRTSPSRRRDRSRSRSPVRRRDRSPSPPSRRDRDRARDREGDRSRDRDRDRDRSPRDRSPSGSPPPRHKKKSKKSKKKRSRSSRSPS